MSRRPHSSLIWPPFVFAAALLLCLGSEHPTFGQVPNFTSNFTRPDPAPNPPTNVRRPSSKRADNRAKQASGNLPQPSDAHLDEKQQAIERAIEQGNQARDGHDYEQALAHYQKAQNLNPQEARAFYGMGNLYSDLYCADSAIKAYVQALKFKKDYLEARIGLGYTYISKERYDDALEQFQTALNLKPKNVEVIIGLGKVYAKKGKYQEAIQQIEQLIKDQSLADKDRALAYIALGDVYLEQNGWEKAIPPYEKAKSLNSDLAVAYLRLGLAQLMSAFLKFSSLSLQEIRMQDMESLSASARQASAHIDRAITQHGYNHPGAYIIQGYALVCQSNYQGAVGKINTYLNKVKELESQLSSIDKNIPAKCDYGFSRLTADGYLTFGFVYFRESFFETNSQRKTELLNEAIEKLRRVIKIKQDYAGAYDMLGSIYLEQGKYEEAAEHYKKALLYETKESIKANIYSGIGTAHSRMGHHDEAIYYLKKAIELTPNNPVTYASLSSVYKGQGNFDEAIVLLKKMIELEPQPTAHSHYFLASAYFSRAHKKESEEDYAEAIKLSKKALEINNAYASAYFLLGQLYKFYKAGAMADEALANYKKAAEYDPQNPMIYFHMADLYFARKHNADAAIEYYKKAIEVRPDLAQAYQALGRAYRHKKDDAEAIKQLQNAIKYDPKHLQAYLDLAEIYKSRKNYPEAVKHLTKATEIAPTDFYPYKELAKIYEEQGKVEEAVSYYEEAMNRLKVDDTSTKHLYLGRIARLQARYADAIGYFQKVSHPFEPDQSHYEIGVTYVVSKNKRAALEQHQQLVQLKSPLAEELLKKIKEMK